MRIAILTFHRAYNCGAMLQAWALKTVLERMGHTVEFPACNNVGYFPIRRMVQCIPVDKRGLSWLKSMIWRIFLDLRGFRIGPKEMRYYNQFRKRFLPEATNCQAKDLANKYNVIIYGSDQIFNPRISKEWTSLFLGENVRGGVKKISYAASIGDNPLSEAQQQRLDTALKSFASVSFRERYKNFQVVADPSLLMSAKDYAQIANRKVGKGDYLFMYSCDTSDYEVDLARWVAKHLNLRLVILPFDINKKLPEVVSETSPDRLVGYIRNAKYVLSGSFHGVALSLVHRIPFLNVRNLVEEPESRPLCLLKRLGIAERLVNPSVPKDVVLKRLCTPVPDSAYAKLEAFKKYSINWLNSELTR